MPLPVKPSEAATLLGSTDLSFDFISSKAPWKIMSAV
jgi:hypothetical protein